MINLSTKLYFTVIALYIGGVTTCKNCGKKTDVCSIPKGCGSGKNFVKFGYSMSQESLDEGSSKSSNKESHKKKSKTSQQLAYGENGCSNPSGCSGSKNLGYSGNNEEYESGSSESSKSDSHKKQSKTSQQMAAQSENDCDNPAGCKGGRKSVKILSFGGSNKYSEEGSSKSANSKKHRKSSKSSQQISYEKSDGSCDNPAGCQKISVIGNAKKEGCASGSNCESVEISCDSGSCEEAPEEGICDPACQENKKLAKNFNAKNRIYKKRAKFI
ncbi:unnamed protein product [Gordionus sp. m RMFG-2023]|uniref:uncharacterized protein LOC135924524 n=1 Tax=Gordionus sp. m RMFG-2023 TaxID=3053472 RepID=UPI0030DF2AF1